MSRPSVPPRVSQRLAIGQGIDYRPSAMPLHNLFLWVSGSPSAAENPPHDRRWRAANATETKRDERFGARHVGLDFLLEPSRRLIDLDNLVGLAMDGLRDAR